MRADRFRVGLLALLFVALPLGSASLEIASGIVLCGALAVGDRSRRPLLGPVAAVALCWLGAAAGRGTDQLVEALGRTWPLAPCVAVPMLVGKWREEAAGDERLIAVRIGLWAAAAAGSWAAGEGLVHGTWPWESPARGPFSHHLTLGYALLPALAFALARRAWAPAACIVAGVLASGASGPLLSLAVLVVAVYWRPLGSLAGGAVAALGVIATLGGDRALHERAVLWMTGSTIALRDPVGTGPAGYREAAGGVQEALQSGYHFPIHAHDAALQIAALCGFAGWIAWAWLLVALWQRSGRAGQAGLAAVIVGGLTQDTLGDLEVIRAATAWALISAVPLSAPDPELRALLGRERGGA